MMLQGKVALVTGGSHGIGRGIAYALAREGARVLVNWSSDKDAAEWTVAKIKEMGEKAVAIKADVGQIADCHKLVETANSTFGHVDFLISNAGIGQPSSIMNTSDEEWDRVINVNLRATFVLARNLMPGMIKRKYGRVITISSNIAFLGKGGGSFATYATSKAGLIAFTKGIAHEGAPYITANCIVPGPTNRATVDEREEKWPPVPSTEEQSWLGWKIPLNRSGTPEDIAATVLFLISDSACFITGQSIHVSGGSLMP